MSDQIEIKNAIITRTMLGIEDHGIMTWLLTLDYGGSGQGFGGYALDQWNESEKRRIGTDFGAESISQVLLTVGVDSWEKLVGQHVRVKGTWGKADAIGHIIHDKWFNPSELAASYKNGGAK